MSKKVVVYTMENAYSLYLAVYSSRPTASRFKKFINNDKRVQIGLVDFVQCDKFLRKGNLGNKYNNNNKYNISMKHKRATSDDIYHTNNNNNKSNKKVKKRKSASSSSSNSHSKSVGFDYRKQNKSRKETPYIPSISKLSNIKYGKNKYKSSSSSSSSSKPGRRKFGTVPKYTSNKIKKDKNKNKIKYNNNTKNINININKYGSKKKTVKYNNNKRGNRGIYGNINGKQSSRTQSRQKAIHNDLDPLQLEMPSDDELNKLLNEIPSSPAITPRNNLHKLKSVGSGSNILGDVASNKPVEPFIEHMTIEEASLLNVNSCIDHRNNNGHWLSATILIKKGSKLRINYSKYGQYNNKYDIWSDYKYELFKFAQHNSITLRQAHRMNNILIGNLVDINPRRHKKKSHHGWKVAEIIEKSSKSGQIKYEYTHKRRKYTYWTHLDNVDEITILMKKVDIPNVSSADNSDNDDNSNSNSNNNSNSNSNGIPMFEPPEFNINNNTKTKPIANGYRNGDHMHNHHGDNKDDGYVSGYNDKQIPQPQQQPVIMMLDYTNVSSWTHPQVSYWFNKIENGRFNDDEYETLKDALGKWKIKGNELLQFNHPFLRMMGVSDENDRKIILKNVKKISPKLKQKSNKKVIKSRPSSHTKTNGNVIPKHRRKSSELLIQKETKKATKALTKENTKLKSKVTRLIESNSKINNQHQMKLQELQDLQSLYARAKKDIKKPNKELQQLKKENNSLNNNVNDLNIKLNEQKSTLKDKLNEVKILNNLINTLNKKIIKKDDIIKKNQLKTNKEIKELKDKIKIESKKYDKLYKHYDIIKKENKEREKQLKLQQLQLNQQKKPVVPDAGGYIIDQTKNSSNDKENELLNGKPSDIKIHDDIKYNTGNMNGNDNDMNTPISESGSASVTSVNSADNNGNNRNDNDDQESEYSDSSSDDFDYEMKNLVIDNGSETIKIGYASSTITDQNNIKPSKKFHSIIGTPKNHSSATYNNSNDLFVGDQALNKRSILTIRNVINRGNVINWDWQEKLWDYTFYNKLSIPRSRGLSNFNVLLTETVSRKKQDREKSVQTMFESYDINSLYLQNEAVLSLYGTGTITGTVLGIGYGVTYATCIYEGISVPSSTLKINSAGKDLTEYLRQILSEKYASTLMHVSHSIIKDMKQKHCFVAENYYSALKSNNNSYKKYKLPDGSSIRIGNARFKCTEQLFGGFMNLNSEKMNDDNRKLFRIQNGNNKFNNSGIQHIISTCINSLGNDYDDLKQECYSNIVLSGGTTVFRGLQKRLKIEINKLNINNKYNNNINIVANDKRKYLPWIGGAILSSLDHFKQNFITNDEYQEYGDSIVHRKCA